jgi:hypothetical protein
MVDCLWFLNQLKMPHKLPRDVCRDVLGIIERHAIYFLSENGGSSFAHFGPHSTKTQDWKNDILF